MKREPAHHCTTSDISSYPVFILILKQLFIERSSIDIYTGAFLGEMCSDRCKIYLRTYLLKRYLRSGLDKVQKTREEIKKTCHVKNRGRRKATLCCEEKKIF